MQSKQPSTAKQPKAASPTPKPKRWQDELTEHANAELRRLGKIA